MLSLLLSLHIGYAEFKVAGEPVQLIAAVEGHFMRPLWSPDGNKIAFTADNYSGLWIAHADGSQMQQISDDPAVGFGFQWSSDGGAILTRVAKWQGPIRYNAIKVFDLTQNTGQLLTEYRLGLNSLPYWTPDDAQVLFYAQGHMQSINSGRPANAIKKQVPETMCYIQNDRLAIVSMQDETAQVASAVKDLRIINLTISPDRQKAAFEILGGPMCVIDSDGSNLLELGQGNRPQWSPDSQYLIYTISQDDGHEITASNLYIIRVDGSEKQKIVLPADLIAMSPAWSPSENKIIFEDYKTGSVYMIRLLK